MNRVNTTRPLSEAFYRKITQLIEASSESEAFIWNDKGTGVLLIDEEALEELLMELFSLHLQTFRKMMMMYGFCKTVSQSGEEYTHSDLTGKRLDRR